MLPADARALAPSVEVDKSYREALHTDYSGHLHPDGTMHLSPEGLVIDSATAAPRGRPFHTCNTHWMLTDFTEANGATRCVPGTHMCGAYPHSIMNEDTRRERFPSEQVITGQVSNRRVSSDPLSFEQRASSAAAARTGRQRHRLERPHLALGHAQHLAGRATLVTHQLLRHATMDGLSGAEVSGRRGSAGGRCGDAGERLPGAAGGRAPPLLRAVAAAKTVAQVKHKRFVRAPGCIPQKTL